ncbi:MAG TPA: hypothetical protein VLM37_10695 [Fibrobacteraceae bacterium]|nr:hypothetical protein [Fibrobacteraceae bacterium]
MNHKYLSLLAASAMLVACSDVGDSPLSASVNDIEDAPSATTLSTNNATAVSDSQVSADLQILASLGTLDFSYDDLDMDDLLSGESLFKKQVNLAKNKVAMAKKITVVASGSCTEIMNEDTTITSGTASASVKIQWLGSDGDPLEVCEDTDDYLSLLDGSSILAAVSLTSDSVDMYMNMNMVLDIDGTESSFTMDIDAAANAYLELKTPYSFNVYMEMNFSAAYDSDDDETTISDGSETYWFQDGTYKCEADLEVVENDEAGKVCDLVNAGNVVGSVWQDDDGDIFIYDADGNEVSMDE